jgi:electron transport complex protein RnfC
MSFFGFKGGVHPKENKTQTKDERTVVMKTPSMVYIPLVQQNPGIPAKPIVKIGDKVLKGQKIGDSDVFMTTPVHSSVSGTVKKIEDRAYPIMGAIVPTIFIENDGEDTWAELTKLDDWTKASKEELLAIIRDKGIVGIGGATFPTYVKLNPPKDAKINTLLLNGAECEPYLNSDNRLMLDDPKSIIEGIKIIKKILGITKAIVGIEANKPRAIENMQKEAKGTGIEIVPLKVKYPQGGEKQLIKSLLNRVVPSGKLPSAVGAVVQNTGTAAAIYQAVVNGIPLIERVVTVSGRAIKKPRNVKVAVGTLFSELLNFCEVDRENIYKLILGGPMMGMAQYSEETPVIKGTSGLLALTKEETNTYETRNCISCGKCIEVCPMGLMPLNFVQLVIKERFQELGPANLLDCMECGSCAFACPANRPLVESIKLGKLKLRELMVKK